MLKAVIIDDEIQSRSMLAGLIEQCFDDIVIAGQAASVAEGLENIKYHAPNIVFLDIQLNGETGFDLLTALPHIDFALVITSAFDSYAIKAFRFNAIDYLLKPIITEELRETIGRIRDQSLHSRQVSKTQVEQLYLDMKEPGKKHDKIAVPTADGFIILPVNEIIYCRANSNYTEFYLVDKKCILSSYTLKQYDEILTGQSFFRAHRSYLVNLQHVKMYKKGSGGTIQMTNGYEIELAKTHKDEFLHLLNIRS